MVCIFEPPDGNAGLAGERRPPRLACAAKCVSVCGRAQGPSSGPRLRHAEGFLTSTEKLRVSLPVTSHAVVRGTPLLRLR